LQSLDSPPERSAESHLIPESANRPGDDPIFALNAKAQARAKAGEDVLNLTIGALMRDDGRMAVMPTVFEAYRRIDPEQAAAYAPISGPPAFLRSVIEDLFPDSSFVEQAVAVATPGGTGAIHHAIVNFLEPGESLLTTSYYWGPYGILAKHTRRGIETFDMFDVEGRFNTASMEVALDRLIARQDRVLILLNTPCHNPTGYSLDDDDWERAIAVILRAAERTPVTLMLDLAYAKFAKPGSIRWPSYMERLAGNVNMLFAWTASKAFAQYGARIGACIAVEPDPEERARIENALGFSCRGTWSNCNHLGMLAITEILTDPELHRSCDAERAELRRLLRERVLVFNEHAARAELLYPRYEGGFFVAVFTPDAQRTTEIMQAKGVFVVPLNGAVRVALCATPTNKIPRLVEASSRRRRPADLRVSELSQLPRGERRGRLSRAAPGQALLELVARRARPVPGRPRAGAGDERAAAGAGERVLGQDVALRQPDGRAAWRARRLVARAPSLTLTPAGDALPAQSRAFHGRRA